MNSKLTRPTYEEYEDEILTMAYETFQPYRCVHCGHAVKSGYCCGFCGSSAPNNIADKDGIRKLEGEV